MEKRKLVERVRRLEHELKIEHQRRAALAYDQQAFLAKIMRLATEVILLRADKQPD